MNTTNVYDKLFNDIAHSALSPLVNARDYNGDALMFLRNNAKTLNYYKQDGLLPERAKKSNFSFVELVWIRIVFELKSIGVKPDLLFKLKTALFNSVSSESMLETFKRKEEDINAFFKDLPKEHLEIIKAEFENAVRKNSPLMRIQSSKLFMFISYMLIYKYPIEIRLYNTSDVTMYDIINKVELDLNLAEARPIYKSYISISLTEIICFYIGEGYINNLLQEYIFSKDELLMLEIIKNEKPKSITVEFNADHTIDLIKTKKVNRVDINQRLSEIFLNKGYEEVTITTQNGKIVNCTKTRKTRPKNKNTG